MQPTETPGWVLAATCEAIGHEWTRDDNSGRLQPACRRCGQTWRALDEAWHQKRGIPMPTEH